MNTASLSLFQPVHHFGSPRGGKGDQIVEFDKVMDQAYSTENTSLPGANSELADPDMVAMMDKAELMKYLHAEAGLAGDIDESIVNELYHYLQQSNGQENVVFSESELNIQLQEFTSLYGDEASVELKAVIEQLTQTDMPTADVVEEMFQKLEVNAWLEANVLQLMEQIQAVLGKIHQTERIEEVASKLMPLLKEFSAMQKQTEVQSFTDLARKHLSKDELEILTRMNELYEKRTHFQSKQIYGQSATVTRSDLAQWLTAELNKQPVQADQTSTVINNEQMMAPRVSVLQQQAIHNSNLASIERIEGEMTQRIATMVQQSTLLRAGSPLQTMSITLTPHNLGTLHITFEQVEGEMMVRIMTNSLMTKEALENNMQQLKHTFSPHQVQIVRDDTLIDEEVIAQQEEEQLTEDEERERAEELEEAQQEEQGSLDFSQLFKELQEMEVPLND